jgi:hypothetical protein
MKRRVPRLATDEEAEAFLESDLSDLDFSQFRSGRLRFERGSSTINEYPRSETYRLFVQAMAERKQIVCTYNGRRRVVCPIILGQSQGKERALTYQLEGGSNSGELSPEGDWKCLTLSNVSEVQLRDGPWYSGDSHKQASRCIEIVDLDVNDESPYHPKRRLADLARSVASPSKKKTNSSSKKPRTTVK